MDNPTCWIDLNLIDLPENARGHTPENLESLVEDMRQEGQLQEIVVSPKGERFEVIAGVGRTLAAQNLGWDKIRCFVRDGLSTFDRLRITFSENEEREDVSPLYQARLLQTMKDSKGLSQRDLAKELGKTESGVSQYLSLLEFSPEVQKNFNALKFSLRQMLEVAKLSTEQAQLAAIREIASGQKSRKVVEKHLATPGAGGKSKRLMADLVWKDGEIVINRRFKPEAESAEQYITWLSQALPAFSALQPVRKL